MIAWDPEELSERSSEARFRRSFRELAPTVEAWLERWVASPTVDEQLADHLAAAHVSCGARGPRRARRA
jgi:hypothetical protein